jgi:MFS family permease
MSDRSVDSCANSPGLPRILLTVFVPFSLGFFLSYLFRCVNAVIAPNLISDLGLGAADLGLMTSAYFLAFACMQLPLGLALDRFGPRKVEAALLLSAAAGSVVFSLGHDRWVLILGRAMIGVGVAGGLMAALKAIVLWFPRERWPLVNGCIMAIGGLGALTATAPVEAALRLTDWRGIFIALSLLTLLVSAIIFLVAPDKPGTTALIGFSEQLRGIRVIFSDRLFWRVAPAAFTTMAATNAIQGLWAGPWLRDVAGLERPEAANHLFVLAAALTAGFFVNSVIADLLGRRGIKLIHVLGGGILLFLVAQLLLVMQVDPAGYWVWALFGLLSNFSPLAHPILSQHFPVAYSGRAMTALNLLAFVTAFAAQYFIGVIIGGWEPGTAGHYPAVAYAVAFASVLVLETASLLWMLRPIPKPISAV